MSDLPDGWEWASLGELGDWHGGTTPAKSNPAFWESGTTPWVSPKDMNYPRITDTTDHITDLALQEPSVQRIPEKSVVFVVRSGVLARRFPVAMLDTTAALNQDLKAITPYGKMSPLWLAHYLRHRESAILANFRKAGTTVSSIDSKRLAHLPVPIPPLTEQRRIVAALEEQLSKLTLATTMQASGASRTEQLKKKILTSAIPRCIPSHWRNTTVAKAGALSLGRQRHPDWHSGPNMRPYLRVANVFENYISDHHLMEMNFPPDTFDQYQLHSGDILLNEGQTPELLGRPAMYRGTPKEVAFTNSLIRFRPPPEIDPEWALLVFRNHMHTGRYLREVRITTNIAHLSLRRLGKIEFPLPPLCEQRSIATAIQERLNSVERLQETTSSLRNRSDQLRRSLLREAFAGRLVPQDPNDEPASVLLERIRAERAQTSTGKRTSRAKKLAKTASKATAPPSPAQETPSPNTSEFDSSKPLPETPGRGTQDTLELDL